MEVLAIVYMTCWVVEKVVGFVYKASHYSIYPCQLLIIGRL